MELSSLGKSKIYTIHYLLSDDDFLSLQASSPAGRSCAPPPERPGELACKLDFLNPFDIKPTVKFRK